MKMDQKKTMKKSKMFYTVKFLIQIKRRFRNTDMREAVLTVNTL